MSGGLPINTIIEGDCLEVMRNWPEGCVDLVLTDPPYGIKAARYARAGTQYGHSLAACRDYGISAWDDKIPPKEAFDLMRRVSGEQIIFGGNYFAHLLPASSGWIVWDKDNGGNGYADCELVWTSLKKAVRKITWRWHGMRQEPGYLKDERVHPTQKPVGVARWIIERYSKPTDVVLDPYCGSGTFCLAAKQLGHNYIGIDISEDYCRTARERLAAVETGVPVAEARAGQLALFEGAKQ